MQKDPHGQYSQLAVALTGMSVTDAKGHTAYSAPDLALPVLLDSGTTATYLPNDIANAIFQGVGAINDNDLGGWIVPCALSASPAKFTFAFGGSGGPSISVSLAQFVLPIILADGSTPEFSDIGGAVCNFGLFSSTPDSPSVLGDTFLRSAYVVYDLDNNIIALAETKFNRSDSNVQAIPSGSGIPGVSATATQVADTQSFTGYPLETNGQTKSAPGTKPTHGKISATFDLGVKITGVSAAVPLRVPTFPVAAMASVAVMLLSMLLVGSIVLMQ